jgi:hypothetical protein
MVGSTWLDSSGNGNHALVSGSALALSGSLGYKFVPTVSNENYLTYPASLVASPSSSFTLQFFGSPNRDGLGQTLFGKTEASSSTYSNGWYTTWNGLHDTGRRFYYYNNINEEAVTPSAVPQATQSLYTFTFVEGSANTAGFYLNDASAVTQFTVGNIQGFNTASAEPFTFGLDKSAGAPVNYHFYNGTVSNIMVYNRILSTDEIAQNYNYLFSSACVPPSTTTSTTSTSTTSTSTTSTTTSGPTTTTTSAPTTTTTSAPLPIVEAGLIIWNHFTDYNSGSGTVTDRSPNGNTAIVSGSTLVASASLGLEFNGTNNFFTYPEPVNATPTGSFTLQFYGTINFDSENRDYFCKNSFEDGWDTVATPYPEIVYRPVAGSDISLDGPIDGAAVKLITTTFDTAGTCELYIDDTLIVSKSSLIEAFNSGSAIPFTFGFNPQSDGTYFKGTFKDITLYNRILTAGEVTTNYNALSAL